MSERLHQVCVEDKIVQNTLLFYLHLKSSITLELLMSFVSCSYFSQLSDSGQKLGEEVRRCYHQLVLMLVEAVQGFNTLNEK